MVVQSETPVYFQVTFPEKNDLHIRIPAAFPWSGWGKSGGKIHLTIRAFSGLLMRCKSAVFWQSERYYGVIPHRNWKGGFYGLSLEPAKMKEGIQSP
jgi:hypothetical protein